MDDHMWSVDDGLNHYSGFSIWKDNANVTRREFLRQILHNNIAIIAIQHSKTYFVDTFGDFSHTVDWNSLKSVW